MQQWLPMSRSEMRQMGWDAPDLVIVTGDAYVDHPSFGTAIIGRVLESAGYRVGIIAQPDWHDPASVSVLGRPKLGFLVNAGNLDSMVAHYTAAKRRRSTDAYTPGGAAGKRPDRALIVYCNLIRRAFKGVPIIIGGLEASLRRFSHYDYWDNKVRHSVLVDTGADLLIYGMGEKPVLGVAHALKAGRPVKEIDDVRGTCFIRTSAEGLACIQMPAHGKVCEDKKAYNRAFMLQQRENDGVRGRRIAQAFEKGYVIANPPSAPLTRQEMDAVYDLPYTRAPHPSYQKPIPGLEEVKFSLVSSRGCYGGCSFCSLTYHQGRIVQTRSHESIVGEAQRMTQDPDFKGIIHDVGGPTANFRQPACPDQLKRGACANKQCLWPRCPNLQVSHYDYRVLLKKLRAVKGVRRVFVRSGLRYDYIMYDNDPAFLEELVESHISGQLKVAPEHASRRVLELMGKPEIDLYDRFCKRYYDLNRKKGKKQFLVPYFISSHPGSDLDAAIELACYMKKTGQRPEQVQDFYPTPGTLSTAMFYTGMDPRTEKPVYVPRSEQEKAMQRALLQFYLPKNAEAVRKALQKAGRTDLIGHETDSLVPTARPPRPTRPARPRGKKA
ncbi:MAG: YgiQ family radical SAM protein [Clostridia bacterium]|nr:YgiQ family radical SAM protein [Clostridia bacterium]